MPFFNTKYNNDGNKYEGHMTGDIHLYGDKKSNSMEFKS